MFIQAAIEVLNKNTNSKINHKNQVVVEQDELVLYSSNVTVMVDSETVYSKVSELVDYYYGLIRANILIAIYGDNGDLLDCVQYGKVVNNATYYNKMLETIPTIAAKHHNSVDTAKVLINQYIVNAA